MAAVRVEGSVDGEGLLYKISEDGKDRGWKVELLAEPLFRVEEKLLLCSYCRGLVREACQCEINGKHVLSCNVCIPRSVAWQPSHLTREAINEKIICCPLKQKGCNWIDSVSTVIKHLEECEYLPVSCPLQCVFTEGVRKGKVVRVERRLIPKHKRDFCPQRILKCEFCDNGVNACKMNFHLEKCEMFPVNCPNGCMITGETSTRQIKRGDVPFHLLDSCPLQIVKCPYWDFGCRDEMERKFILEHQIEKCFQRIVKCNYCNSALRACKRKAHLDVCEMFPVKCPNGCVETGEICARQVKRGNLSTHLSDDCPLQILECPYRDYGCGEKMKRRQLDLHERDFIHIHFKLALTEVKDMKQSQIETGNKILSLEKANASKDFQIKQLKNTISTLKINTSRFKWKIKGVREKITGTDISYSPPFYIGLYKCQCKIVWSQMDTGRMSCYICIVNGNYDNALKWPFIYRVIFLLPNLTIKRANYVWSHEVSKEDLQCFPECFQKPTSLRNRAFGVASFISYNELLTEKYCSEDNIFLNISVEQLPTFY